MKYLQAPEEMLALYQLAQGLTAHLDVPDAAELIAKHLRRVVPASTIVFYIYDTLADELYVAHAAGDGASHFAGLRIPRGQRLSGWVAANRQSILILIQFSTSVTQLDRCDRRCAAVLVRRY